jgi:uncharacterized membrane protein YeaQ/YmgE (transglycosylase-associated protein family)
VQAAGIEILTRLNEGEEMGIIAWIIIGALAGWIGSMITGTNAQMGAFANIIVGIIGALVGGFLFNLLGGEGFTGFNFWSLFVSTFGAIILLTLIKVFSKSA